MGDRKCGRFGRHQPLLTFASDSSFPGANDRRNPVDEKWRLASKSKRSSICFYLKQQILEAFAKPLISEYRRLHFRRRLLSPSFYDNFFRSAIHGVGILIASFGRQHSISRSKFNNRFLDNLNGRRFPVIFISRHQRSASEFFFFSSNTFVAFRVRFAYPSPRTCLRPFICAFLRLVSPRASRYRCVS